MVYVLMKHKAGSRAFRSVWPSSTTRMVSDPRPLNPYSRAARSAWRSGTAATVRDPRPLNPSSRTTRSVRPSGTAETVSDPAPSVLPQSTTEDAAAASTTPMLPPAEAPKTAKNSTKVVYKATIVVGKVVKGANFQTPNTRLAEYRRYIAVAFILILILLAALDAVFLQIILRRGDYSNRDFVVLGVTIFVIAMNFCTVVYLLKMTKGRERKTRIKSGLGSAMKRSLA